MCGRMLKMKRLKKSTMVESRVVEKETVKTQGGIYTYPQPDDATLCVTCSVAAKLKASTQVSKLDIKKDVKKRKRDAAANHQASPQAKASPQEPSSVYSSKRMRQIDSLIEVIITKMSQEAAIKKKTEMGLGEEEREDWVRSRMDKQQSFRLIHGLEGHLYVPHSKDFIGLKVLNPVWCVNELQWIPLLVEILQMSSLTRWAWSRAIRSPVEQQELQDLINLISNLHLSLGNDLWECTIDDSRLFTVKVIPQHLQEAKGSGFTSYVACIRSKTLAMTTLSANNSVFRGFFEKQKLAGPNFIDCHFLQRNLENLHANDILKELKTLFAQQKQQAQMAARGQNQGEGKRKGSLLARKGKNKLAYAPKPKISPPRKREDPAKDSICHECGIFTIELNTFLNRSWIFDTGYGTHICNTTQGLRASRKLKQLEIVLNNCHYAPSITKGVISVSRLYEDGFINCFVNNTIQVSRNNMVYFSVIPRDGIFEIDLSNSYANESSIYTVSNKRAKLDLDSALLWHCRLGHISKKRIEKLQHEGLLNSTDLRAFKKCVPYMSRKMARKPY
ncbi:zinc finger, CCHC-type containing protein [Tanacetum coccineum]|uniref:Zinc finger, CCHC-type containing protein n=1 Tax=Tanacetum coccineum TaxID=301880 RepID=A0ABQ4Y607_9ASTR